MLGQCPVSHLPSPPGASSPSQMLCAGAALVQAGLATVGFGVSVTPTP